MLQLVICGGPLLQWVRLRFKQLLMLTLTSKPWRTQATLRLMFFQAQGGSAAFNGTYCYMGFQATLRLSNFTLNYKFWNFRPLLRLFQSSNLFLIIVCCWELIWESLFYPPLLLSCKPLEALPLLSINCCGSSWPLWGPPAGLFSRLLCWVSGHCEANQWY